MKTHLRRGAGFSIVEVMVALVVLAVGMLGIASLYVTTLRSSASAMSRMQAVNLATDLADRIRANRFAGTTYAGTEAADNACKGTKNCTKEEMAKNDLYLWQQQIDDLLPGSATESQGTVAYTAGVGDEPDKYTITVAWKEPGTAADEAIDTNGRLNYALTMQVEP
jgi:type IV pilus assembly protein PilV